MHTSNRSTNSPLGAIPVLLWAALFSLPFCSVARVAPNPAFWGEWAAILIFGLWWLAKSMRPGPDAPAQQSLTATTLMFIALALLTLVQTGLHHTRFASESLLAASVLLLAALVSHQAQDLAALGRERPLAQAAAFGLIVALWVNAIGVALGFAGLGVVFGHVVPVIESKRSVGFIGQANQLGMLAVMAIAAIVALRLRDRLPRWLAWLTFLVASLVCATSGSRVALVVFAAMAALYAWYSTAPDVVDSVPRRWSQLAAATLIFAAVQLAWAMVLPMLKDGGIEASAPSRAGH